MKTIKYLVFVAIIILGVCLACEPFPQADASYGQAEVTELMNLLDNNPKPELLGRCERFFNQWGDCRPEFTKRRLNLLFKGLEKHVNLFGFMLADDAEFDILGRPGVVPLAGKYLGKREALHYIDLLISSHRIRDVIVQFHLVDAEENNKATSHINIIGDVPATGKRYDLEFLYKWEFSQDLKKIKKLYLYYSTWHFTQAFMPGGDTFIIDQRGTDDFSILDVDFNAEELAADLYNKFYVQGDVASVLAVLTENVVFIEKGNPALPSNGVFHGVNGFLQMIQGVFSYQIYLSPPTFSKYVTEGNKTDATLDVHFGDAVTGKEFWISLNQSWIFGPNGEVLEFKSYHDSQEIYMNHIPD